MTYNEEIRCKECQRRAGVEHEAEGSGSYQKGSGKAMSGNFL